MPNRDLSDLQGEWAIVTLQFDGNDLGAAAAMGAKIIVKEDAFSTTSMGADYSGRLSVDSTATPKQLDICFEEGPRAGLASLGIYTLDGDTWTICLGLAGMSRPTDFVTTRGSNHALESLRRMPPGGAALDLEPPETSLQPDRVVPVGGDPDLQGEWTMSFLEVDGAAMSDAFVRSGKRVTLGNETIVTMGRQIILRATYTTDRSTMPWSIDYLIAGGPDRGKTQLGIYELQGDALRFCFAGPGFDRPTEFATTVGSGRTLTAFIRTPIAGQAVEENS